MEEQPSVEQPVASPRSRFTNFFKRLAMILGGSLTFVVLYCLINGHWGNTTISNGFFWAGFGLLVVAAWPILGEVMRSFSLSSRVKGGRESYQQAMETERQKRDKGASTTYLFGTAGILTIALAFLSLAL